MQSPGSIHGLITNLQTMGTITKSANGKVALLCHTHLAHRMIQIISVHYKPIAMEDTMALISPSVILT